MICILAGNQAEAYDFVDNMDGLNGAKYAVVNDAKSMQAYEFTSIIIVGSFYLRRDAVELLSEARLRMRK